MKKYIMALDQGTTSSRCILFDKNGNIAAIAQKPFQQYFPASGWVEHNAAEIWETQLSVAKEAMAKINASAGEIGAIGITNQRETTVIWDKATGKPIAPAIVWQCRRTADFCDQLIKDGYNEMIREKTGLLIDPYFSGTKIRWILDHAEGAQARAEKGELLFGTIETWLLWNLTAGKVHVTDYSNASRTMLFNIHSLTWDKEILKLLNIPECMLPTPHPNSEIYGETTLFGKPVPIGGLAGDQQAALFGQTCFQQGDAKNTYGTGCFMLLNTGEKPVTSQNGLLTTIAWGLNGKVNYALEGSVFVCGSAIQWLVEGIGILENPKDSENAALAVKDTDGVYMVPAFTGLGAPYWNPHARGIITGISRGSNRNHIIRATLESLAYQTQDVLQVMCDDAHIALSSLNVDGGVTKNNFLMQFQADISNTQVIRPCNIETTAMGAAFFAGLSCGFWQDLKELKEIRAIQTCFKPQMSESQRQEHLIGWQNAVKMLTN